ncbi:MAG: hypothetical protein COA52_15210 [Hyphomicrobiales bacterium]|nr:MAG: hypothetical protein COA52_15210 [Hyphomicrobiales bacterium]
MKRREADIAIRNFRPTEPDLIAKKVGDGEARLYATTGYIEQLGIPRVPYDLRGAAFVGLDRGNGLLNALNAMGFNLTVKNFPVSTENHLVMWDMVRQGLGIGVVDDRIGEAEPLVQQVLPEMEPMVFPIWLVAHRELNSSRRIRMVFDLLAKELAKALAQNLT